MSNYKLLYTSIVDVSIGNGPGVNEREFIESLSRTESIEAKIIIPKPKNPEKIDNIEGVNFFFIGRGKISYLLSRFIQPWKLLKEIRINDYDGIIIRSYLFPLFLTLLICWNKIPVYMKTQGNPNIEWLCSQPGFKGWISRFIKPINIWLHKKLFNRASVIDCCTPQLMQSVQELIPEQESQKVIHIENATNTQRFQYKDKTTCRRKLGMIQFDPIIGYVGGVPSERGGEHIIKTVAELSNIYPNIGGCVVGGTEKEVQILRNLAEELKVTDRCFIPGLVDYDQVPNWINSFDIGIALDRADRLVNIGSSNQKIRQYLACGRPVIAGKNTSSFVEDCDLGKLVNPDDINEFVDAVNELLNLSPDEKERIARAGRGLCQKEFSIEAAVLKRIDYWKEAMDLERNLNFTN